MKIDESNITYDNVRTIIEDYAYFNKPKGHDKAIEITNTTFELYRQKIYDSGIYHHINMDFTEIYLPGTDVKIKVAE